MRLIRSYALLLCLSAPALAQAPYSGGPLATPSFSAAQLQDRSAKLTGWLEKNYPKIAQTRPAQPREDLYALIDAYVRLHGTTLPEKNAELSRLLRWAEPLGVVGGHLLYNHVRMPNEPEMRRLLETTPNIELTLQGDLMHVTAPAEHWSFDIPWYFMIQNAGDQVAKDGLRQQVVMLATGFANHTNRPGSSQATLLFIHAPGAELKPFVDNWYRVMKLSVTDEREPLGIGDLTSQLHLDPPTDIQTEFVSWMTSQGPFAVFYSGIRGTYEHNREHFLDFMRALQAPPATLD